MASNTVHFTATASPDPSGAARIGARARFAAQLFIVGGVTGAATVPALMRLYSVNLDQAVTAAAVFATMFYLTGVGLPRVLMLLSKPEPESEVKIEIPLVLAPIAALFVMACFSVYCGIVFAVSMLPYSMLSLSWAASLALRLTVWAFSAALGALMLAGLYFLVLVGITYRRKLGREFVKVFRPIENMCRSGLNVHGPRSAH